ncbi:MAG: hypothetical protein JWO36_7105 [Myxococcales bacterium]|nr:hypothetical protein [Myxococcales bacterium]
MPEQKPNGGSERFRDEKREGGPRVHGHQWVEDEKPVSDSETVTDDAVPEAESGGDREGIGKAHSQPGRSRK